MLPTVKCIILERRPVFRLMYITSNAFYDELYCSWKTCLPSFAVHLVCCTYNRKMRVTTKVIFFCLSYCIYRNKPVSKALNLTLYLSGLCSLLELSCFQIHVWTNLKGPYIFNVVHTTATLKRGKEKRSLYFKKSESFFPLRAQCLQGTFILFSREGQ
jgi:hypothetical protein